MPTYEHLKASGIEQGSQLAFKMQTLGANGFQERDVNTQVERFAGGGFYGSVILTPDFVIKTGQPDALHTLLRQINWPVPFPSQANESAARQDHLAGRIIHRLVPRMTNGNIVTPEALGYTKLNGLGYAQVIERMHGRGPVFNDGGAENHGIQSAREQIWELGVELGLEHAAQVHPHNPFGKPNIWVGEDGKFIWLDTLPAFRHTGKVKPVFRFPFHYEVQKAFGSAQPTYNTVHTDRVRAVLNNESHLFAPEELDELHTLVEHYDDNSKNFNKWVNTDPQELFIQDAVDRGSIDLAEADRLRASPQEYQTHHRQQLVHLGANVFLDKIKETPIQVFWNKELQTSIKRFAQDPSFRWEKALGFTLLRGMKNAHEHGLISDTEFEEALSFVPKEELKLYVGMQIGYALTSRVTDIMSVFLAVMASASASPAEALAAVGVFNVLAPPVVRSTGTIIADRLSGVDLKRAALISGIPMVGGYTAIPIQLKHIYGAEAGEIEHYTLRSLVATLSKLRPGGGWGSDAEEKLWNLVGGEQIKKLGKTGYNTLF